MLLPLLIILKTLWICVGLCNADQVTFTWDANTEPDLAGYRCYWGSQPNTYLNFIDVGLQTTCTLEIQPGTYVAATAYDTEGLESDFSNEVFYEPIGATQLIAPIFRKLRF